MLSQSPEPSAEEWAIHDHECFHGIAIHEYESFDTVTQLAEFIEEHEELGAAIMNHAGDLEEAKRILNENYCGEWNRLEDWAEELLDDTGALDKPPENMRCYSIISPTLATAKSVETSSPSKPMAWCMCSGATRTPNRTLQLQSV